MKESEKTPALNSLRERLKHRFRVPPELTGEGLVILRGRDSVTIRGCRRILLYSPTEIMLEMRNDSLSVTGTSLYCTSFSAGTVTVEGKLSAVSYQNDRARENVKESDR